MTQEEKRRIGELRAAGCSYIRIAAELNISVNSIKSYCRRHSPVSYTHLTLPTKA